MTNTLANSHPSCTATCMGNGPATLQLPFPQPTSAADGWLSRLLVSSVPGPRASITESRSSAFLWPPNSPPYPFSTSSHNHVWFCSSNDFPTLESSQGSCFLSCTMTDTMPIFVHTHTHECARLLVSFKYLFTEELLFPECQERSMGSRATGIYETRAKLNMKSFWWWRIPSTESELPSWEQAPVPQLTYCGHWERSWYAH